VTPQLFKCASLLIWRDIRDFASNAAEPHNEKDIVPACLLLVRAPKVRRVRSIFFNLFKATQFNFILIKMI